MTLYAGRSLFRWNGSSGSRTDRRPICQVRPGRISQGVCGTGLHALRFSIAEEAFGGFVRIRVERHHLPRAGLLTYLATDTFLGIYNPGICWRLNDNGIIRTGIGARHRVRTLLAKVLNDQTIAPVSLSALTHVNAFRSKVEVPSDLNPRYGR